MQALIVGAGLSGRSAEEFLTGRGIKVTFATKEEINNYLSKEQEDRLFNGLSFIVTSPGVPLDVPLLKRAKARGYSVVGEFELGVKLLLCDIIAVTGTNGKTTTVSLIHFLLKDIKQQVFLGGNIGVPVTSFALNAKPIDIAVLECSSYQLETINSFKPHIAAILNLSVDHMARHKTMQNYMLSKFNITSGQTENDYLLINADCDLLMKNLPQTRAKIYYFSTKHKVYGCYIKRSGIYFNDNLKEVRLASIKGLKLIGEHNKSNVLAAVLAVWLQTKNKKLFDALSQFTGVPHRIEYICTAGGIAFYNDSKATNISSTLVATRSFKQKINLILGGSDKGYEFDELFENLPKNVKFIAVCGGTKFKILEAAKRAGFKNIVSAESLKDATNLCLSHAEAGEVVLLSPACASFDFFKNFEERGMVFKKIVEEILSNETALGKSKTQT